MYLIQWVAILLTTLTLQSCTKVTSNCIVPGPDLVSWWRADQLGSAEAKDSIGSRNATPTQILQFPWDGTSSLGSSFFFGSHSSYMTIANSAATQLPSIFTIFVKLKPEYRSLPLNLTLMSQGERTSSFNQFEAYDAGNTDGLTTKGYRGGAFDGRYVYFVPLSNVNGSLHANILRYDTDLGFKTSTSWGAYDPISALGLSSPGGFVGAVFDGRSMYFVSSSALNGLILKYDTRQDFKTPDSWSSFDPGTSFGNGKMSSAGGTFDGQYIYFNPAGSTSIVYRYNTQQSFTDSSSWTSYSASNASGLNTVGYTGSTFDGRYIYFVPDTNSSAHAAVLRYDTFASFSSSSSWSGYDASSTDGLDSRGYRQAAFDGRYVFFSPNSGNSTTYNGYVLRYDTRLDFQTSSSWSAYDANGTSGLDTSGYSGIISDGRYMYFVPFYNTNLSNGITLRHDAAAEFKDSTAWVGRDSGTTDGLTSRGMHGAVFDGRYIYYVPYSNAITTSRSGIVLRYDTNGGASSFDFKLNLLSTSGFGTSSVGPSFRITTDSGDFQITGPTTLQRDSWNSIAATYDGTQIQLFMNGVLLSSKAVTGTLASISDDIKIGTYGLSKNGLNSRVSDIQIYRKILSATELLGLHNTSICK